MLERISKYVTCVLKGHSKRLQDNGGLGQSHWEECAVLAPGWQWEKVLVVFCRIFWLPPHFWLSSLIHLNLDFFPVTYLTQCFQSLTLQEKLLFCRVRTRTNQVYLLMYRGFSDANACVLTFQVMKGTISMWLTKARWMWVSIQWILRAWEKQHVHRSASDFFLLSVCSS